MNGQKDCMNKARKGTKLVVYKTRCRWWEKECQRPKWLKVILTNEQLKYYTILLWSTSMCMKALVSLVLRKICSEQVKKEG